MLRLLSIELQKLRYNRAAKVISIIYFALITSVALIVSIEFNIGDIKFRAADQGIFNFPYIWHFNSHLVAYLKIFLAIVIVSMTANEYSYRTIKQNLIDGLSKKEFILSKFITVVLFSAVSTLFLFIVSLVLGLIFSDYTELSIIFSDLEFVLAYFIKLVTFFSFCLFLGIWVKRSAFALGFLAVWQIVEFIIYLLLWRQVFDSREKAEMITQFLPLSNMWNLLKEPFTRFNAVQSAANQLGEQIEFNFHVEWHMVLTALIWTFLFIYGSYRILKRRDL